MNDKDYGFTGYNTISRQKARRLRKSMTRQEKRLWYDYLRTYPVQFTRQRPIDQYIVDFYCSAARLVIELDGSQHFTDEGVEYDVIRTDILERYGLTVLRFSNSDVERNFEGVCMMIDARVQAILGDSRKRNSPTA